MRLQGTAIALLASLSLTGCGTVFNFGAGTCPIRDYPCIYGGVGVDVDVFAIHNFPLGVLFALIDLPFSIVADTFTLPWTIPATITHATRPPADPEPPRNDK